MTGGWKLPLGNKGGVAYAHSDGMATELILPITAHAHWMVVSFMLAYLGADNTYSACTLEEASSVPSAFGCIIKQHSFWKPTTLGGLAS